jgi:hypothetical protein
MKCSAAVFFLTLRTFVAIETVPVKGRECKSPVVPSRKIGDEIVETDFEGSSRPGEYNIGEYNIILHE